MWAVLGVECSQDQPSDHDKEPDYYQNGRNQVFTLEPAARGESEEAPWWDDEDQRSGTQGTLKGKMMKWQQFVLKHGSNMYTNNFTEQKWLTFSSKTTPRQS